MYKVFITICLSITILLTILISQQSIPSIQYFPISDNVKLQDSATLIGLNKSPNEQNLIWSIYSDTNETSYLRQDISLLYVNGQFAGVISKWKQNVAEMYSEQTFSIQQEKSLVEAITFHYAETHEEHDNIRSVQAMTSDKVYALKENEKLNIFTKPSNKTEKVIQQELDKQIGNELTNHWDDLINYFNIDELDYTRIGLTEMVQYDAKTLPNQTETKTDKIIGQFWEGLYKKYVLLLKDNHVKHYMPLILYAKDQTHLLLLFSINNQPYKYIQQL